MADQVKALVFPYSCARFVDEDGACGYVLDVLAGKTSCRVSYDNGGIKVVGTAGIKPEGGMKK